MNTRRSEYHEKAFATTAPKILDCCDAPFIRTRGSDLFDDLRVIISEKRRRARQKNIPQCCCRYALKVVRKTARNFMSNVGYVLQQIKRKRSRISMFSRPGKGHHKTRAYAHQKSADTSLIRTRFF